MIHVAITIIIAVLAAGPAFAFDEPDGFRGVPWGASENDLRQKLGGGRNVSSCHDYGPERSWLGHRFCLGSLQLADVTATVTYGFRSDRFTRALLRFPSKDFERMVSIFIERYGEPTARTADALRWDGLKAGITLNRYSPGDMAKSWATVATQEEIRESTRLRKEQL